MNYDQAITEMLAAIKADKSLAQPWKNYAASDLARVQAVIRMAKNTVNKTPPEGQRVDAGTANVGPYTPMDIAPGELPAGCICPLGAESADCPVHGH